MNKLDVIDKAIVDQWMLDPNQSIVKLITENIPKAKAYLPSCSRRFKDIMKKPEVEAYVSGQIQMLQRQVDIDLSDATKFLAGTLNSNIADFIHMQGDETLAIKDLTEMPRDLTAQVKKLKIKTNTMTYKDGSENKNTTVEFELYDKMAAIDRLAKALKWWEENKGDTTLLGVLVLPEGKSKEQQWAEDYVQLPDGTEFIPAGDKK